MLAYSLAALFILDRLLKFIAVVHFFRRPLSLAPELWPTVTLIQPITRSENDLRAALWSRAVLDYPATIQYLFVCDADDSGTQALCREWLTEFPALSAEIIVVEPDGALIAAKVAKLQPALSCANGEILCFIDDDIALRPDALRLLTPYLYQPGAGAAFGLACYTRWSDPWSSLMSGFVNANALLSYIPLTYLIDPFTVTGHCFVVRRKIFDQFGGFSDMKDRVDDDHELARRVRKLGLSCIQTPLIYDVDNKLDSFRAYAAQMKRWFVFPRQAMFPMLRPREQLVSLIGSIGNLIPGLLGLLVLFTWRPSALGALGISLGIFAVVYWLCETLFISRRTPLHRWPLLILVALIVPLHIIAMLFANDEIKWRGQRLRVKRGGGFEVL